jgi:Zn-dependent M28 family amino/carboxypeptidase
MRSAAVLLAGIIPSIIAATSSVAAPPAVPFPRIDASALLAHTRTLSSDQFEGRAPGTRGEERTVAYIADQFRTFGLEPGAPDGSYFQRVPLVGITPDPRTEMVVGGSPQDARPPVHLAYKDDVVAWSKRMVDTATLDRSELVFVGYGVQAPEFQWDDFKGADLKGKTLVFLIGDPPVPDPADPTRLDPRMFGGQAMTYYGRWTYKFEMAAKMGAAGALIIHETGPAGYPFTVVQVKVGEQFDIARPDRNMDRAAVEGWLSGEAAGRLLARAGKTLDQLKRAALGRDFRPMPLDLYASMTIRNSVRTIDSRNVVAKLTGSDPEVRDECVLYSAHWDAFGIGAPLNGDPIYHGAVDNAVAVAGLLEIAHAYARMPVKPRRTIIFLAVTAEEQLMLGSEYYASHPVYPLDATLAVINLEMLNVHGRTRDLTVIGLGTSDLDDIAGQVAREQGRRLKPDPEPERGMYYRSDHFSFARRGVPAFEPDQGDDYIGKPAGYGRQVRKEFYDYLYHKPSDTVKPDWDLSGGVEDLQLDWMVGYLVAQGATYPQWKPGAEFGRPRGRSTRR